ncbi:MAG: hypothetical protein UT11_C0027G0015 [Berkelbacteria bacterium GW2011_GWA2_38_9]|uniref:Uncharacterized protein n=1 Tax=Berkelbacteria bacterium GW2011_GWA2_38_9 TaxID=1618334 RepID=A0A0G0LN53_9BACT|nr:MAG: hypothetical protein UT11_C0027G0015 [Berkelbacteria bacterium GW2011_GWA2_38_9]
MINLKRLLAASAILVTILYVVCFVVVAIFPAVRTNFMLYGLHTQTTLGENAMTIGTFIGGLILWNVLAYIVVGLFGLIYNKIKE